MRSSTESFIDFSVECCEVCTTERFEHFANFRDLPSLEAPACRLVLIREADGMNPHSGNHGDLIRVRHLKGYDVLHFGICFPFVRLAHNSSISHHLITCQVV